jgi:glycerophosphoryl diester phosphodiesterase
LTADRHPVVIHDQTVDRTTDGVGQIGNMSLFELKELDAGSFFNTHFRGEKIPTLEEVLEEFGGKIFINIELTNYSNPTDDLPQIVADLVIYFGLQEEVLFSSFNPLALFKMNKYLPQTPKGLLVGGGFMGTILRSWINNIIPYDALHPEISITTSKLIQKVHHSSQRVHVYTVNHAQEMSSLIAMGVDGIFTDDPILARKIVNSSSLLMDESIIPRNS